MDKIYPTGQIITKKAMNIKQFLTINAFMFIPFGIGMLTLPNLIFPVLDVKLSADGLLMARTVGSMLFSFGLICLFARNAERNSVGMTAVLIGNFSFHTIDFLLTGMGALSETMNPLGFMFSSIHLMFALGFLYFLVKKSR